MRVGRVLVVLGLLLAAAPASDAATATTTAGTFGVIVQVSSLAPQHTPSTLGRWLDRACATHPGTRHELVVQDVAGATGPLLTAYLDVIVDRLPGGRGACFDRAFVGTAEVPWRGAGSPYVDGILDPAHRRAYLSRSKVLAAAFSARYPRARFDWYVTYEANLNELARDSVASAYRDLLVRQLRDLDGVRRGREALWSPAFWFPHHEYSSNTVGMAALERNLRGVLVAADGTGGGLAAVSLQEYVVPSSCQPAWNRVTTDDVIQWVRFVRSLGTGVRANVNLERFAISCRSGALSAASAGVVAGRARAYAAAGVDVGTSFEVRYWAAAT